MKFSEKMEIRYFVYFLFKGKGYRPLMPPKTLAIVSGFAIVLFLLGKTAAQQGVAADLGTTFFSIAAWYLIVLGNLVPSMNLEKSRASWALEKRFSEWKAEHKDGSISDWLKELDEEVKRGEFHF